METLERTYPAPREWGLSTRLWYSWACNLANEKTNGRGIVDWARVGSEMTDVLEALENPAKGGKGTQATLQEDGQLYVQGVGKAGLDISQKSEPWRRGYYDVLMYLARTAENLDGWVRDITRDIAFPPEVVIGPSNSNPRSVPFGAAHPPLEENCIPAWGAPEIYYTKLLTTQGFSTRQRLDAAIAWADWLDFKGLRESAEATYDWALDIALGALPMGADNTVDIRTGIISADATYVSQNLLQACTALGTHHSRNDNLTQGLPILLSVLRARRTLSTPPQSRTTDEADTPVKVPFTLSSISTSPEHSIREEPSWSWSESLKTLIFAPTYPPPPPDHDLPPVADSPDALCAEATLTAHIGEVLFAGASSSFKSSSSLSSASKSTKEADNGPSNQRIAENLETQAQALGWTREAVDLTERALLNISHRGATRRRKPTPHEAETRRRCQECLEMALSNWEVMLDRIMEERDKLASAASVAREKPGRRGWFSLWCNGSGKYVDVVGGKAVWEQERMMLEERKSALTRLLENMEEADKVRGIAGKILGRMR